MVSLAAVRSKAVVDSLFIVVPIMHEGYVFGPCFVMLYLGSLLILKSSR